jgi:methylmalonyl-CoA/ethylmalonyl-CoA epimerase
MKLHHVAIAVQDLDDALDFYQNALGAKVKERRKVPDEGVEIAFLSMGESELELLEPLDPENAIGRFLSKRGEGIHHLCLLVDNLDEAVATMAGQGVQMATEIREHPDGTRYVFIHPKSAHGVLLELYEVTANPA